MRVLSGGQGTKTDTTVRRLSNSDSYYLKKRRREDLRATDEYRIEIRDGHVGQYVLVLRAGSDEQLLPGSRHEE